MTDGSAPRSRSVTVTPALPPGGGHLIPAPSRRHLRDGGAAPLLCLYIFAPKPLYLRSCAMTERTAAHHLNAITDGIARATFGRTALRLLLLLIPALLIDPVASSAPAAQGQLS